jgi:hypothetical protein
MVSRRRFVGSSAVATSLALTGCLGGIGGASESNTLELPFVDPADNLDELHEVSGKDKVTIDDGNNFLFARPAEPASVVDRDTDQKRDSAASATKDTGRIKRAEDVLEPVSLVYGPFKDPERLLVEAHYDGVNDFGTVTFEQSSEDGNSWEPFEPEEHVYNDSAGGFSQAKETTGAAWRNSQFTYEGFDGGVVYLRLILSDGLVPWTPQIGTVRVE